MKYAALYIRGKVVMGVNHGDAYSKLSEDEKAAFDEIISGFFNKETEEFCGECSFYTKNISLLRHGSVENFSQDPTLSSYGIEQVEKLANYLKKLNLKNYNFYTSPLLRCLRTSSLISSSLNVKINVNSNLYETIENEQIVIPNRSIEFPELNWDCFQSIETKKETPEEFIKRIKSVLDELPHKSILITHYGVILNVIRMASGNNNVNTTIEHASITHIKNRTCEYISEPK